MAIGDPPIFTGLNYETPWLSSIPTVKAFKMAEKIVFEPRTAEEERVYKLYEAGRKAVKTLTDDYLDKQSDAAEQQARGNIYHIEESDFKVSEGRWGVKGGVYFQCDDTADKLAPGVYEAHMTMSYGPILARQIVKSDELLVLPDDASEKVLKHIEEFWQMKSKFNEFGFLHKRGVMLYGPPGGGKTSTVVQTLKYIVDGGGIGVLVNNPFEAKACLSMLRQLEPDRPAVVIIEDIDDLVRYYGDRTLTELLDGEANIDNVLYLATTNYPERLPTRLINRPSRFDVIMKIGLPGEAARRVYLEAKAPSLSPSQLDAWVEKTHGLTISHLKELLISVLVYDLPLDTAIARLDNMFNKPQSADDYKN